MLEKYSESMMKQDNLVAMKDYKPYPIAKEREAWQTIDEQLRASKIKQAEQYSQYTWGNLYATDFLAYEKTGDRKSYEEKHFKRRDALQALVIGECLEYQGRFMDSIVNGIWCICEESFWGVSAHNGVLINHNEVVEQKNLPDIEDCYIDLFASETAGLLAWTYYLLEEELEAISPVLTRRIHSELHRRIKEPFLQRYDFWWMGYMGKQINNWNPWILANTISVFLLTEESEQYRKRGIKKAMECLDQFIEIQPKDGGCDEGTTYWNVAGGALFDCLIQLDTAIKDKTDFFEQPIIKNIGSFIYKSYIDNKYFINFADGAAMPRLHAQMMYRYGKAIQDVKLMGLASYLYSIEEEVVLEDVPMALRRTLPDLFTYEVFKKQEAIPVYDQAIWMDNTEVMATREREGTQEGLFIAAKAGHNDENHNHNDVGHFIVYLDGRPAIIDVGVAAYTKQTFGKDRYAIWTMQSKYHSTPTLNGCMQEAGSVYRATDVTYRQDTYKTSLTMDIAKAYHIEAGVDVYRREIEMDRGQETVLHITDTYRFKEAKNNIRLNLMSWMKPELDKDGKIYIQVISGKRLCIEVLAKEKLDICFENMPTNDTKLYPVWGSGGVWHIEINVRDVEQEGQIITRMKIEEKVDAKL